MKKFLTISMTMLLVLALLLTGCQGNTAQNSEGESQGQSESNADTATSEKAGPAVDKDTVVVATADETSSISPYAHNAVAGEYINKLTHNGLFKLDKDLNPQPDLVDTYAVSADENGEDTIWTMKLHEGIKFHNGETMTADDVVASIEYAKEQPDVSVYASSVETIEAVDELTVKITTEKPSANLLYNLCHHGCFISPKAHIGSEDFDKNPIGSGPYKYVDWKLGEKLTFEAFADYFDKENAPKIKNVIWKIIPEGSSRTIALESGEVDYIIELDSSSLQNLEANADVQVVDSPSISHNWLTVNNEVAPFDDKRVRKAISKAINRQNVLIVALNEQGIIAESQTPMGMLGENSEGFDSYDLEGAKKLLEEWGGDPASIKLEVICSNDTKRRAAEVIQADLLEIGIKMDIVSMDLATYLSETANGNFTGFIGGFSSNEMMTFLQGVYHSKNINSSNKTRTNEPKLDALIDKALQTIDQTEREAVLKETSAFLNEECYQMPLYQNNNLSAAKANLDNLSITAGGSFFVSEWAWK